VLKNLTKKRGRSGGRYYYFRKSETASSGWRLPRRKRFTEGKEKRSAAASSAQAPNAGQILPVEGKVAEGGTREKKQTAEAAWI